MDSSLSLEKILRERLTRLDELKLVTMLIKHRGTLKDQLLEAKLEMDVIKKGIDVLKNDLEIMKAQSTCYRKLSAAMKELNTVMVHMNENFPAQYVENFKIANEQLLASEDYNGVSPVISDTGSTQNSMVKKVSNINLNTPQSGIEGCKKTLFKNMDDAYVMDPLNEEEFTRIPKYMIGRQSLAVLNDFVATINAILEAKYGLLTLGKAAARKKGKLDLYLSLKRDEIVVAPGEDSIYFFTAEDYQRHTQTKLDKTKLNLLTVLRHCKRLRELRAVNVATIGTNVIRVVERYNRAMTSTTRIVDSNSATPSDTDDCFDDDVGETSVVWAQDDPHSTSDVIELETRKTSTNADDENSGGFCRLCAGRAIDPVYIYSEFGESMKLAHKMNTCLSVKIKKTDPLPKQLCHACVEKINWCDAFDEQCIRAEETLATMLRANRERGASTEMMSTDAETRDEQSCPLCVKGHMQTRTPNVATTSVVSEDPYDSDIVMDSSDEEKASANFYVATPESNDDSARPGARANSQQYLKCGACMNLYHTRENLDIHKCKPCIQVTSRPYKCSVCNTIYPFEERLKFHMQFHEGAKQLYCAICNITFGKELKAFYHYKRYHCEDKSVSCLQCGKLFACQQELRSHVCVDGKTRPHVCEICSKSFTDGYTLKRHVVTHLPEKPYKCAQCSKSFTQKSRLNKHVAGHGVVVENTQVAWKCVECGQTFPSCNDADTHNRKCHGEKISLIEELTTSKIYHCEFCNSFFNDPDSLGEHESRHVAEKPYACEICDTVYKSYAEAVLHWKEHPQSFRVETAYLCDVCGKDMKEMSLLYKHRRKRHHVTSRKTELDDTARKYVCELCGKLFDERDDLRIHGRDQCSKFPCDICGNLLPTANSLHAHKRRHNGLRPYVCNICGKSYTQSSHMWTHKRFHMGVKPYACQYCDQRFTIKPDLADHERKKHTRERPFKCDVCNKAFLTGSVFYQHRLIHRGDRRYKCHYCEKAFTRTEALNNHIKIHTGEKPHACDVCGRCFRQKGDMRKHRRTQHNLSKDELP